MHVRNCVDTGTVAWTAGRVRIAALQGLLKKFIGALAGCIHPLGTLALAQPRPCHTAAGHGGGENLVLNVWVS